MEIRIEAFGEETRVHLQFSTEDEGEETSLIVVGVELNHGTTVFRDLNGGTLKHASWREDPRVSTWTYSECEPLNGLCVHSSQKDAFPVVEPNCDGVDSSPQ